ncbi:MAG: hypothetical protein H0A76_00020 [Candidatus Thiodubiliella endoseptemdiera]|uniref:Uncharacterized protein n=1 Tax=Candidatus Thiodubiliella endoseptemdiera TaxID=2738886 RepID=A0A853EZ01_9GAMM|nr:hypothetical protein [Candidatus Thiodubiliella endoseptemdiera]
MVNLNYYYNQQPSSADIASPNPNHDQSMDSKRYSSRTICFKTGDISLTSDNERDL